MMPSTLFCDNCGAANQARARYCRACGRPLHVVKTTLYDSTTGHLMPDILLKQRYRIIAPVGRGGMGAVYRAEDTQLGNRLVALKEMSQGGLNLKEQEAAAIAFKQEALMLACLQHPNLPSIFDHFEENGRWYLVMSYIEGETLEDYLKRAQGEKLPQDEALQIGIELSIVLGYLHNQQPPIIFRDLKPANIMHTIDGHIYLIDFGIARHFKPGQARDTAYIGSPGYAPPEQYGKAQTTPRSDIYSLGVTLYQLFSGHDPASSPFRFPPLQLLVPTLPTNLATFITQMLEMDEDKRPANALLVKQELQRAMALPALPFQSVQQTQGSTTLPPASLDPHPNTLKLRVLSKLNMNRAQAASAATSAPVELPNITSVWQVPGVVLLNSPEVVKMQMYGQDTSALAALIQDTLRSFRVDAEVRKEDISIGPTIIRFGIRPTGKPKMMLDEKAGKMIPVRDAAGQIVYATRTRVSRIMALQNDLALVLEAQTIRMEAPVPGRPYVGVEIPNKNSRMVTLREVLESKEYSAMKAKSKLAIGLGKDMNGLVRVGDLAKMPHLLIAGVTGSGKSVMINTIIASILTQATPDDVRLLMVDPKMVELNMYNGIPHLLSPVVVEMDKVVSLLKNAIVEMERRYRLFSQLGVRNLDGYHKMRLERIARGDLSLNNLPSIVIIIDELTDLMMAAPEEVEGMIVRLAQLVCATGIHLVLATKRPSGDVIMGLIKANVLTRISFMVSSAVDSRTIIDVSGAERLLGRGDMLYLPTDTGRPERIQGAFLSDDEAQKLADYWRQLIIEHAQALGEASTKIEPQEEPGRKLKTTSPDAFEMEDDLLEQAEEVMREYGRASISLLQRRLRIGYSRASRLIDLLEESGVIGHSETSGRAREVYEQGQSLLDKADGITDEERSRNEFLRNQAARLQARRDHN